MKSFSVMVKYCEGSSECRHAAFSKHFGDKAHDCKDKCDVCSDAKGVKKKVEGYQQFLVQKEGHRHGGLVIANGSGEIDTDLYEGGRRGTKRSFDEAYGNSDDESHADTAEKKAKEERETVI